MRKSLNLLAGVFLFVLVFSFFGVKVDAASIDFDASISGTSSGEIAYNDLPIEVSQNITQNSYGTLSYSLVDSNLGSVDLNNYYVLKSDKYYKVDVLLTAETTLLSDFFMFPSTHYLTNNSNSFMIIHRENSGMGSDPILTGSSTILFKGSDAVFNINYSSSVYYYNVSSFQFILKDTLSFSNLVQLSDQETEDYQSGYNAGYSDGLSEGHSQGYSNGYSDGYSAGESSGYDSGYQAGVDSVDTQSYYDAGYSAGQASGYAEGYDSGYDTGYSDAMARVESWGADTSSYPKLVDTFDLSGYTGQITCARDASDHEFTMIVQSTRNRSILSDHVYRLNGILENFNASNSSATWDQYDIYVNIGSEEYKVFTRPVNYSLDEDHQIDVFIPGYLMSSSFSIKVVFRNCFPRDVNAQVGLISVLHDGFDGTLTDCGPINNSQNETAKQTDDLTNGYDSSAGDSVSNTFSDNASSLDAAEDSIFTSAKSSLDGYSFFDINSVPAVVTGLSFVSATMTSIFGAMGGASGAGIVLSVLFSVMIVSIVIGLYRYFVSSGKSGSGKGGRK